MASNGYSDLLGWTVGRLDWLNNPTSKVNRYWRVIEEGSEATKWPYVGRTIVGLWGDLANSTHTGDLSISDTGRSDQKFVPWFSSLNSSQLGAKRAAIWFLFDGGNRNLELIRGKNDKEKKRFFYWLITRAQADQIPFVAAWVQRPIKPAHYYLRAMEAFNPVEHTVALLRQETAYFMGGKDITTTAGLHQARRMVAFDAAEGTGVQTGRRSRESRGPDTKSALVTVRASAQTSDLNRDAKGRFSNYQSVVRRVNQRMAEDFQAEVVKQMYEHNTSRPATGALLKATKDPRNRSPI